MVNSNSFKDEVEYKTYYKQNLDDDLPPFPGMIPRYKFINGRYVGEVLPPIPENSEVQYMRVRTIREIDDSYDYLFMIPFFSLCALLILRFLI